MFHLKYIWCINGILFDFLTDLFLSFCFLIYSTQFQTGKWWKKYKISFQLVGCSCENNILIFLWINMMTLFPAVLDVFFNWWNNGQLFATPRSALKQLIIQIYFLFCLHLWWYYFHKNNFTWYFIFRYKIICWREKFQVPDLTFSISLFLL